MHKYLWSASLVPGTAHSKCEWNGAQGRQTSCTIAKVYISREEWVTSQTVILVFKKINRATDKKVIQMLYFRGKGIGMGSCWSVVMSNSLQPHGLQHARPPCPSSTHRVCSNSCQLSWWCHPTISSSTTLFSFCLQKDVVKAPKQINKKNSGNLWNKTSKGSLAYSKQEWDQGLFTYKLRIWILY